MPGKCALFRHVFIEKVLQPLIQKGFDSNQEPMDAVEKAIAKFIQVDLIELDAFAAATLSECQD
eukprot:3126330-Pyramimonas_sp.AAC.1